MTVPTAPLPGVRPGPTVSPLVLPRAQALTDVLVAGGPPAGAAAVASARRLLEHGLAEAATHAVDPVPCLRIRAFDLVRPGAGMPDGPRTPFRWTARTGRRRVGLAAIRSCLANPGLAPADAVARVVADPGGPAGPGPRGPGSCADWLASLSPPARAVVQASATAWATAVWTAVEWDRVPAPLVGAPDRWWDRRDGVRVALQGRADVRVPGPGGAHLVVLDGYPSSASRRALAFGALVDALRSEGTDVPARVVGWWPDCGKAWASSIDGTALRTCAEDVVGVVRRALRVPVRTWPAASS